MEHVVFYPSPEVGPAYQRVDSLADAVDLVEQLRNVEGVQDATVFALTPVPLTVRAYYKVELPADAAASETVAAVPSGGTASTVGPIPSQTDQPFAPASSASPTASPAAPEATAQPALDEPTQSGAGSSRGGKKASLGYFAR